MKKWNRLWVTGLTCVTALTLSPSSQGAFEQMLDLSALDRSVDPCSDFYAFSCGGWLSRTELPADRPSWTRSFSSINEENLGELRKILEAYAAHDYSLPSQNAKKLGDFYSACTNLDALERSQTATLQTELAPIQKMKKEDLTQIIGQMEMKGFSVLFQIGSSPDAKDASQMIAEVDQGGLSLPNRDYYLQDEKAPIRANYVAHVSRILELSGLSPEQSTKDAQLILAFETELAKNSLSPVERRDPQKVYHLLPRTQLSQLTPLIQWDSLFDTLGAPAFEKLNIAVPAFLKGLNALLSDAPLEQIQAYFRWRILHSLASNLGKAFIEENFNFYGRTLSGQKELKPRWKSCVQAADRILDDALGEAFVRKTFGEDAKTQTLSILKSVKNAFRENLASLAWMDTPTREYAIHKLEAIQSKIGFPEKWTDFSSLSISPDSHLQNQFAGVRFWSLKTMKKIGQPVDRTEWEMTPPTVNAYYNPPMNEIVFPAGILQSPLYSPSSSLAVNYGAIGMIIGHELTHGFDDQGRQYDEKGNLKDWWTQEVGAIFDQKAQCIVDQYSSYVVADDVHINGKLTLGENIADLGGLKLAYAAYQVAAQAAAEGHSATVSGSPAAPGLTSDQQFFVSFAQSWCTRSTQEYEKLGAASDPHSAPKYRVNGTVTNLPEFERAFSCASGAPLAPKNRCSIW